ncbi:MAG: methionine--tRNA ligase [Rudaea sp.]|uniref:methionine--tRNA ligase n=1 Tax=unclassified Rudaea TaxID=2627037 RepID=UPI0010F6F49A|nr:MULTISPECIES: methionine--tRNA ligase [unclassified Rudaea]MBN8884639.1 methionine--tRNA ligase [Rudaea sp.]
MSRKLLVTHALPYANGPLHIGHLLGYLQCDIWVRARRMAGDTVVFVSADDAHGTPIMLAAEKAGLAPEEFIKGIQASHERDFADFSVVYDNYYTTHSDENRELASLIYGRLRDAGHIDKRTIRQLYDPVKNMFLPDRYIKGTCPNCGTPDQYGDNCENCGATYAPTDLIDPRSVVSGATPELRDSEHYFFKVGDFTTLLRGWLAGKLTGSKPVVHSSVAAKLKEWLDAEGGVRDWDISRDAPYFGFPIPDAPGKFFYVWLDAPVGYLASFKNWCAKTGGDFDAYLAENSTAEMHHFIGKDIVNFHGLFWPAMLHGAKLRTPTALHVNGYLTVNGAKMSKSRGTFIEARTYLDAGLDADYLRYYYATILSPAPVDVDLDLKAFEERVNSHLVGKWVNIASRTAGFVHKHFGGRLAAQLPADEAARYADAAQRLAHCAAQFDAGEFAAATREIMAVADEANAYVAENAPWNLAKDEARLAQLHTVCTLALNYFRLISIYLAPIVPATAARASALFNETSPHFDAAAQPLLGTPINEFSALATRIDAKKIEAMIEASKTSLQANAPAPAAEKKPAKGGKAAAVSVPAAAADGFISIDDFARLDLRVGLVLQCAFVDGSDKLLRFELDAGALGKRQIFSGIRAAYPEPEKLVGRRVVFIANLAPRKMRFGVSEGMILSAGTGDADLFLLDADAGAQPGAPVK